MDFDFLFGYGSLVNRQSRAGSSSAETFLHDAIPASLVPSARLSLRREWNFRSKTRMTALGVRRVPLSDAREINGVIYPVRAADLPAIREREVGYDMVQVHPENVKFESWQRLPAGARVFVFVPQGDSAMPADAENPILQSYVDVCVTGFLEYGEPFARKFVRTTFGWSRHWVDDRLLPRRPWVYQPKWKVVDTILGSEADSAPFLRYRALPMYFMPSHVKRIEALERAVFGSPQRCCVQRR